MKILNVMLSRGWNKNQWGGLEKATLDYLQALQMEGHEPHVVLHRRLPAHVMKTFEDFPIHIISPLNNYDPFAQWRLNRLFQKLQPDWIIAHGGRAARLSHGKGIPVIGVTHLRSFKYFLPIEGVIPLTTFTEKKLREQGQHTLFRVPNMIRIDHPPVVKKTFHSPPIIGTLARFIHEKGLHIFLKALAILKETHTFQAIIGGDGEEKKNLLELTKELNLTSCVSFIGWVQDKESFYERIDLFCLPSLEEPFGLVVLEAWLQGRPVVATATAGPLDMIDHSSLVPPHSPIELAKMLANLLDHPEKAFDMAQKGVDKLVSTYAMPIVAKRLTEALNYFSHVQKEKRSPHS